MNKELKAWEMIKNDYLFNNSLISNEIEIVETALKKQEKDKKFFNKVIRANLEIGQRNKRLEKLIDEQFKDLIRLNEFISTIEEQLKYGYVFIGYDKNNKPLFQFADVKLYEEIKKHMIH